MFDNETRQFVYNPQEFEAPWYEDREGYLYIDAPDEIIGPDNYITDELNRLWREKGGVMERDLKYLGLTRIPVILKRFHPLDGYYHA